MKRKNLTSNNRKFKTKKVANIYDGWEDMSAGEKAGGIASATAGALQLVGDALNSANKIDTSKADNAIAAVESYQPQATDIDSLANQINSFEGAKTDWKGSDFGMSTAEGLTSLGTSMASGAAAGATLGPWGAVAGAAAGLVTSGAGWIANAVKSKSKAEELNRKAEAANYIGEQKGWAAINNLKESQYYDFMKTIKSYGGPLYNHSGDWSNGLTFINEGGTHEENPFDGVLMGFDQEGVPNLVEEGEIIYNDYVFSNRLKPSKKQLESSGLNKKYNDWTFAKIVEDLQKTSAETPLDKISKESLDDMMTIMINMQEEVRMKKGLKGQNKLMANGGNLFVGGGPNGTDPYRGMFIGDNYLTAPNIKLSTSESNPILPLLNQRNKEIEFNSLKNNIYKQSGINTNIEVPSFIDVNEEAVVENPLRVEVGKQPYDSKGKLLRINSIQNNGVAGIDSSLIGKSAMDKKVEEHFNDRMSLYSDDASFDWGQLGQQVGQALPIISNAAKAIYNAATPIDYSNVIAEQAYRETPVMSLPRLGGKQVYRGIDRNRLTNPIINTGRATARDIQNNALTAGQALANLANANYNTQRAIGEAYANADQQDLANRLQVAQFNLGIDQANANLSQTEQAANIERTNRIATARIQDAAMREQLQQAKGQAFDKTSNAAIQGVADLVRQNMEWDWIKKVYPEGAKAIAKNGGILTRKKRRK